MTTAVDWDAKQQIKKNINKKEKLTVVMMVTLKRKADNAQKKSFENCANYD